MATKEEEEEEEEEEEKCRLFDVLFGLVGEGIGKFLKTTIVAQW